MGQPRAPDLWDVHNAYEETGSSTEKLAPTSPRKVSRKARRDVTSYDKRDSKGTDMDSSVFEEDGKITFVGPGGQPLDVSGALKTQREPISHKAGCWWVKLIAS